MTRKTMAASIPTFMLMGFASVRVAQAAPPTDACSLLTPAQVSSVLGFAAKPGHSVPSDKSVCDWPLASLSKMTSPETKEIEVSILNAQSWALLSAGFAAGTPLEGVGDIAVYQGASGLMTLYVKKGNAMFSVNVHGFTPDQIKEKEKTLAQQIAAKL